MSKCPYDGSATHAVKRALIRPATFIVVLFVSACSGTVREEPVQQSGNFPPSTESGIIFYPRAYYFEVSKTTVRIDKDGKVIGTETNADPTARCTPIETKKLVMKADLKHPRRIFYQAGLLENNQFSVELSDGMLKSVNTSSQPDRGATIANLASAAGEVRGAFFPAPAAATGLPACNAGEVATGLERYVLP